MNNDPVICCISSYKEGQLIQGAIRSVHRHVHSIFVCEGATEPEMPEENESYIPTDLGPYSPQAGISFTRSGLSYYEGTWKSEADKRSSILRDARRVLPFADFWILVLDADEILVWGEYLVDYLSVLNPGRNSVENVPSLKRTEAAMVPYRENMQSDEIYANRPVGVWTDLCPSRCYHSSLIERYSVGAWQIITQNGQTAYLDNKPSERTPAFGEPHIHHRPYLRRGERKSLRLTHGEEERWLIERGLKRGGNVSE